MQAKGTPTAIVPHYFIIGVLASVVNFTIVAILLFHKIEI